MIPLLCSIGTSLMITTTPIDITSCDLSRRNEQSAYTGISFKSLSASEKDAMHAHFLQSLNDDINELFVIAFYAYQAGEMDDMFNIFDAIEDHMRLLQYAHTWRMLMDVERLNKLDPLPNDYRFE